MGLRDRLGDLKECILQYTDFVALTYRTERDKAYDEIMDRKRKKKERKKKEGENDE